MADMEDSWTYDIGTGPFRGMVRLVITWRDANDEIKGCSIAYSVRELARMRSRAEMHEYIRELANRAGITEIPPNVEAALLVLALGEPPLQTV